MADSTKRDELLARLVRRAYIADRITTGCAAAVIGPAIVSIHTGNWVALSWQGTTVGGFTVAIITMQRLHAHQRTSHPKET